MEPEKRVELWRRQVAVARKQYESPRRVSDQVCASSRA